MTLSRWDEEEATGKQGHFYKASKRAITPSRPMGIQITIISRPVSSTV